MVAATAATIPPVASLHHFPASRQVRAFVKLGQRQFRAGHAGKRRQEITVRQGRITGHAFGSLRRIRPSRDHFHDLGGGLVIQGEPGHATQAGIGVGEKALVCGAEVIQAGFARGS